MAPYDSDSSDGEEADFTETNVLLGYAAQESQDDVTSYIGGQPVRTRLLESLFRLCGHAE
jgi:pre-rRNA-processing protein TSR4